MSLAIFYFSSEILNMFRALICPSSGVRDCVVELPHWLISFLVCCVLELGCGSVRVVSGLPAEAQHVHVRLPSLASPSSGSIRGCKKRPFDTT